MTGKKLVLWVLIGIAAAVVFVLPVGLTPKAAAQDDTLTKTYTTLSGIIFSYPEGWIVTEEVEGGYTTIELDSGPSADEKTFEEALDSGEVKIEFNLIPASQFFADTGLPADTAPDQILMRLLDPRKISFRLPYAATIGGAPAARADGTSLYNWFDFTALAGQLGDGTIVIVRANTARDEMQDFEAAIIAICDSITPGSGEAIPVPTEEPTGSTGVPENNAVDWQTETVSLTADNFYIIANDQIFTANVAGVEVDSDPGDEAYTTLEIEWEEHGILMRLNMYFESDGSTWQASEIRNYDGSPEGEWIMYPGKPFKTPLGEAYETPSFERVAFEDGLYFKNLRVQAFTSGEAGAEETHVPTGEPVTVSETITVPVTIAGPEDCRNAAVSIGDYSSEYSESYSPVYLLDGDPTTGWSSAGGTEQAEYVVVNLDGMQTVSGVLFNSYSPSAGYEADSIKDFSIETTISGETRGIFKGRAAFQQGYQRYLFDPVKTDHLRFVFTSTHGGAFFEAADILVCAAETQTATSTGQELRQWASGAAATSQYSDTAWNAVQATGAPDTAACGDNGTAWASSSPEGIDELVVTFDTPVLPTQVNIYQTFNPGAIVSVTLLLAETGDEIPVPNSADPGGQCPGVFTVTIPEGLVDQPVDGIAILVDQSNHTGWNEIDAVELVGITPGSGEKVDLAEQLDAARHLLYGQKDYAGALEAYDAILIVDPTNAEAYYYRCVSQEELENYQQAVDDCTLALEYKYGASADVYRHRGMAYDKLGDYTSAITDLTRAIALAPEYESAYQNRAYVYHARLQEWDLALADYQRAAEIDPNSAFNYNGMGWVLAKAGRYDEALEALTQAITLDPEYERAYQNRAYAYTRLQEWEMALADRQRAVEINPSSGYNYNEVGWALVKLGRYDEALEALNRSLELDPNYGNAWDSRGWAYLGLKDYDLALADFEQAISMGETYSYYGLGQTYYELGEMAKALENLQLYVENAGDSAEQAALDIIATIQTGQPAASNETSNVSSAETVALAQNYTTTNGQISFSYPDGWFVYEDLGIPYIYNSPEAQSRLSIGLESGQVALQITQNVTPGLFGSEPGDHVIAFTKSLVDYLKLTQTAPTEITINGHNAAYALATSDSWNLWGIAIVAADDRMIEVLAYTAPGEFEQYEPTIMAIVESVVYTP